MNVYVYMFMCVCLHIYMFLCLFIHIYTYVHAIAGKTEGWLDLTHIPDTELPYL